MRLLVLVPLLVAGGLFLAVELDRSAGSTGPVAEEVTLAPSNSPAPSPESDSVRDSATEQPTVPPEPDDNTHRQVVLDQFLCTNCHGLSGGWVLPDSHLETATQACEDCHAPAPKPSPVVTHYNPRDTATQELCTLCHGDIGRQDPPPVAPVVGAADACVSCHAGDQRVKPLEDHDGRSVATCTLCHETQPLTAGPVPHQVQGWENCSFCHGRGRLTPLAGGHKDIPRDGCLDCHEAPETPPEITVAMRHLPRPGAGCISCHDEDKLVPLPLSHEGRSELLCTVCHSDVVTEDPLVPHSLTPRNACSSCHSPETLPVRLQAH